jgi:hypothetical protein
MEALSLKFKERAGTFEHHGMPPGRFAAVVITIVSR